MVCTITMQGFFNCSPQCHICIRWTIVLLLVKWSWCCLLVIILMQLTVGIYYRAGNPFCTKTRGVVVHINFFFFDNGVVLWESNSLVVLLVHLDWACRWEIPVCIFLFLLSSGNPWCCLSRQPPFIWLGITSIIMSGCPTRGMNCDL